MTRAAFKFWIDGAMVPSWLGDLEIDDKVVPGDGGTKVTSLDSSYALPRLEEAIEMSKAKDEYEFVELNRTGEESYRHSLCNIRVNPILILYDIFY